MIKRALIKDSFPLHGQCMCLLLSTTGTLAKWMEMEVDTRGGGGGGHLGI